MTNYVPYHVHTELSNATFIDSITSAEEYIEQAKSLGMTAFAFSEHGNILNWQHKKDLIEKAGMKYIHACECYMTENPLVAQRDNYHIVLLAKNYDGVLEINKLTSNAYNKDGHFYYVPRITFDELKHTSKNVLVTTACVGGVLGKAQGDFFNEFCKFLVANKERCYIEIQHHHDPKQVELNQFAYRMNMQYGVPLIAGTDTHCLNAEHERGRGILQKSKHIEFNDDESNWNLKFLSYDGLIAEFESQHAIARSAWMTAIENTCRMADSVDEFQIAGGFKYPHISDDPNAELRKKTFDAMQTNEWCNAQTDKQPVVDRVNYELNTMETIGAADYILLQERMRRWEESQGIVCGPGRGSVSGSMVCYLLGITKMNPLVFGLNFERFMNAERVTLADIDTDYGDKDREKVKSYLLDEHMGVDGLQASEIVTFNTIATKGAVLDVARALDIPLAEAREISKLVDADKAPRDKYPKLFEYVDLLEGTVVSIGSHPSGVLIADCDIASEFGTCRTSGSSYPISVLNMHEVEDRFAVKLDELGLDNVNLINETCRLAGIDILTPDTTDFEDMEVWESIRNDTTGIFQWESNSAQAYLRRLLDPKLIAKVQHRVPKFSMLKWMSFGNGLIRPACASYRDKVLDGNFFDNGLDAVNDALAQTLGYLCMQEDIMRIVQMFCGYTMGQSDVVRRAIAKKRGTDDLIPKLRADFIAYTSEHYGISADDCDKSADQILKVIQDASAYAFSWNHSDAYSAIGYMSGWLRYYYPYEFITAALNTFADKEEKIAAFMDYANANHIKVTPPKFGVSKAGTAFNKELQEIAGGTAAVKFLNADVSNALRDAYDVCKTSTFVDTLDYIFKNTSANARQIEILIKIGYFADYGNANELLSVYHAFQEFGGRKRIARNALDNYPSISPYVNGKTKDGKDAAMLSVTDCVSMMNAIAKEITDTNIAPPSFKDVAAWQNEFLGHVNLTTNNPEDRRKLYINDVYTIKNKNGVPWKHRVEAKSIGSGKACVVYVSDYSMRKSSFDVGDILFADVLHKETARDGREFWNLLSYNVLD